MQTRCHLSVLIHEQAKKYGTKPVITFRNFGSLKWKTVTWNQFSLRVKQVSNAMLNLGIKPQENIAVFSQNCIHYLYTDFGAYGVRAVTIPFYATSSEQQIQYVINDAAARFLFVGEQEQYDKAHRIFALCPTLERIIIFDDSVRVSTHDPNALYFSDFLALGENLPRQTELEQRWKEASDDDLCNILYTSGTTELIVNTYPKEIQQSMRETHPTCMASVPRFWEKVYTGVKDRIDNAGSFQRKLFLRALAVGRRYNVEYLSRGKRPPLALQLEYRMYNKTVLSLVRKQLGLENPNIFPTAGATVSPEVEEFVHAIGIPMLVGYGLTESLATVSCDHKNAPYTIGSVGRPIEGIQIKIGENNEILLKGPTITRGYYKREAFNATIFDADGFFRTGDAGYLKNGELYLTDRIKDLFKTSNGKYIAPQMIETMMLVDKYIDQVAVVADRYKFVSALVVPEFRLIEEWARDHDIPFTSREDLCASSKVRDMLKERIDTLQQPLANYEKIKYITLLPHHFSLESGELTNTLKLRRAIIYKNYKELIDKMYEEQPDTQRDIASN